MNANTQEHITSILMSINKLSISIVKICDKIDKLEDRLDKIEKRGKYRVYGPSPYDASTRR